MATTSYPEIPAAQANKAPAAIFDRVFRGEHILITRYGRPYVLLCPPPEVNEEPQRQAG
jgi:antitoxin (DNA-binding transcriptional repressor) of toxin-antitoxin stability system